MWRFSITGDIGLLVNHEDHPTSGKEFLAGFPTQMGNRASIFQSYQLVPPEADTCFTVHFTTSTLRYSKSIGRFSIAGYGDVPLECQERGAECDIRICGRNTLDIVTSSRRMWRFSITGDIGLLVKHEDHPTSGKEFLAGFPTQMGNRASIFQSYQLVKTHTKKAQEWIDNDPFTSSDGFILVSRIVIRYILWTHQ
jgi:hypothetical protein